jgi:CII-binding regulator of phage lambda lysogenization HflD
MKTIKQIADEIGVSKTAVFKKIKQEPLQTLLKNELTVNGNTVYVSEKGMSIIKSSFLQNKSQTENQKNSQTEFAKNRKQSETNEVVYDILKDTIATLQKQLDAKDRQIEELTSIVKEQAQSINADNKKSLAEKLIEGQQLVSGVSEPVKKKWWPF